MEIKINVPEVLFQDSEFFQEYTAFLAKMEALKEERINPKPKKEYIPLDDAIVALISQSIFGILHVKQNKATSALLIFLIKTFHCLEWNAFDTKALLNSKYLKDESAKLLVQFILHKMMENGCPDTEPEETTVNCPEAPSPATPHPPRVRRFVVSPDVVKIKETVVNYPGAPSPSVSPPRVNGPNNRTDPVVITGTPFPEEGAAPVPCPQSKTPASFLPCDFDLGEMLKAMKSQQPAEITGVANIITSMMTASMR